MPDWWTSPPWLTALGILGLFPVLDIDGTPKVAYVGSPLLRLCEVVLWMDRIRVNPGYYTGRSDSRFRDEIVKYFNEVSRSSSIFKGAYDDFHGMSLSMWIELYIHADHYTSGSYVY
jgi:hypothetical protein